ncbi:MAG: alpha/beta hydrolase [Muribaculaceae bacterium]|nr:alpha/beta hydrolase [Muribaculaceae bacterium]
MNKFTALLLLFAAGITTANSQIMEKTFADTSLAPLEQLSLTTEWDKVFPKSDIVKHCKVTFVNRYGITLAADVYMPQKLDAPAPAIAISGPFGAVKEQSSGFYGQNLAERGFITLVFDPSFTGESGGMPRRVASPDINTEDFSAAVDFLSTLPEADENRIGILGICGFGGFAINAAANDPRVKATVASTMYDISRCTSNGYFDADDNPDSRYKMLQTLAERRTADYRQGSYARAGGVVDPLPEDAPQFVKDYYDYYKTPRGYHPRSGNSNDGWNTTSNLPFVNFPLLSRASEIRNAVMVLHGENAHSLYMGKTAFSKLQGNNKELLIVPGASHCDLYDNSEKIPFDSIAAFFSKYMPAQ